MKLFKKTILIVIQLCLIINIITGKKILFQKKQVTSQDNEYYLNSMIGNIILNLKLSLKQNSLIKSNQCQICQTPQLKNQACSQSCFSSDQQVGIKCVKPYCKLLNDQFIPQENSLIVEGKKAYIKLQIKKDKQQNNQDQQINFPCILANKMSSKVKQMGYFNPLLPNMKIFKKFSFFSINDSTLQLIHGQQLDIGIVGSPLVFQFDQQQNLNQFQVGQIKLQKNDPLLTVDQTKQQQFVIKNTTANFDTQLENLFLPKKIINKITSFIIQKWLNQNNNCTYKNSQIACASNLSLDSLNAAKIQIILDGIELSFPISALIYNIKQKSFSLKLSQSQDKNVKIGYFIFDIFAFSYNLQSRQLTLLRIDNNWSKYYNQNRKRTQGEQYGYFWGFFHFLFIIFYYIIKAILFLAIISILINCIYKRDRLQAWFLRIVKKVKQKRLMRKNLNNKANKSQLEETQQQNDENNLIEK